ncbi:MAG: GNAT family N-acetyltransferase, partial [Clostridia bacterium]|nr:GNAT family N-acetyltransferase [Clostridia bacterium]
DYLVYGPAEEDILDLPDDICEKGPYDFHRLTQDKGWMVYQAHPFRQKMLPTHPRDIDGMETFNGNPRHDSQNRLATAFATRHSLHTIAGSDIHRVGDAGIVGLLIPEDAVKNSRSLADWLRQTPHPRVQHQEPPHDGIRYIVGAVPHWRMLENLYKDAGWSRYVEDMRNAMRGIENSLRVVTAWDDAALVGMGRIIGDQATILYVQDILVLGAYQRRGIGQGIMRRLLAPYDDVRQVVLITDDSPATRGFYRACGFESISEIGCAGHIRLG